MDIVARAKGLLMTPLQEWGIIAAEPADTATLFKSYVIPLAAVPAVAGLLGTMLMGGGLLIGATLVGYVLALVGIFVLAKIIEVLAPRFGGPADPSAALKLAAYAPTASWVGGAFMILPFIGWIPALAGGLYSLFLFYVGTPVVMRIPRERVMGFALSVVLVAVLVNILIGAVIATLF
ncbi:MAG: YIP1 family protein [Roseococcus sp.]|nr:YIP1 family protein [Roseococcus sp.]